MVFLLLLEGDERMNFGWECIRFAFRVDRFNASRAAATNRLISSARFHLPSNHRAAERTCPERASVAGRCSSLVTVWAITSLS